MARMYGADYFEERPETEWTQQMRDWYDPIARQIYLENRDRDRLDPLYMRGGGWDQYPWGQGIRFPEPPAPLKLKVTKLPGNILPDILYGSVAVSARVMTKIEKIEPNVHQFIPLEIELPDGTISDRPYWRFCDMNVLDTLVLEKSEQVQPIWPNKERFPDFFRYGETANGPPVLALNKAVIAGKAIWQDYKLSLNFFSDDLANWLDAEGIKGWESDGSFGSRRATIIEV